MWHALSIVIQPYASHSSKLRDLQFSATETAERHPQSLWQTLTKTSHTWARKTAQRMTLQRKRKIFAFLTD